jgi:Zn-finger nucleic acid-binding protein
MSYIAGCTGKVRYASVEAASAGASALSERIAGIVRSYLCSGCHGYHLTTDTRQALAEKVRTPSKYTTERIERKRRADNDRARARERKRRRRKPRRRNGVGS